MRSGSDGMCYSNSQLHLRMKLKYNVLRSALQQIEATPTACEYVVHTTRAAASFSLMPRENADQRNVSPDKILGKCDANRGCRHIAVFRMSSSRVSGVRMY